MEKRLSQSWSKLIKIGNDCSQDNTDEVVQQYLVDERIRYIKNEVNSGAALSRNRALKEARGRWIAFLDSDDLWSPNKLEKQVAFMAKNGYHFSYTNYEEIDSDGQPTGVNVTGPKSISKTGMFNYCWPGCLTVMYDADYIGLVQIKDIKKNNDYAMWLKISQKAECWLLDETLAKYRKRMGSISRQSIRTMIGWHYKLWCEVEEKNPSISFYLTVKNLLFGFMKKILYRKVING